MKKILLLFFLLFGIFACKDDVPEPEPKPFDKRDSKVGTYRVINSNPPHDIRIEKLDSATISSYFKSWLKYYNVMEAFPVLYYAQIYADKPEPYNSAGVTDMRDSSGNRKPYVDKYGHRWLVSSDSYEENGIKYNRISNDTLRLYLYMTNIKYRIEDGVPYEERYVKIEGVKVK